MKLPQFSLNKDSIKKLKLSRFSPTKWDGWYLLVSFLLPFLGILAVMNFGQYEPFGDLRTMLYSDEYHQYYPFFLAFRENLKNGNGILWSWDVGMGMNYLGLIAYYLGSPFTWLSILVPDHLVLEYYSLLMPIKLGLAGLFFAIFLKGLFRKNDYSIAVFGAFYALCAWSLSYQWNIMWLDSFALFPLVILGTIYLLRDRKFILFVVSLFFAFASNYYIGYIVCIGVLLFFICYQICRWRGFLRFLQDFGRIALFSLIALGLTAWLTLPGITALQQTQSSNNSLLEQSETEDVEIDGLDPTFATTKNGLQKELETFGLNIVGPWEATWEDYEEDYREAEEAFNLYIEAKDADEPTTKLFLDYLKKLSPLLLTGMIRVAGNVGGGINLGFMDGLPNIYCGIIMIFLATLFLTAREVKLRDKLCSVGLLLFLTLSFIIRQLDFVWHGFHYTNMIPYRFSFLFSFVVVYMAYRAWLLRDKFKLWQMFVAFGLSLGMLACTDRRELFKDLLNPYAVAVDKEFVIFLAYNLAFLTMILVLFIHRRVQLRKLEKSGETVSSNVHDRLRRTSSGVMLGVLCLEIVANVASFGVQFPYTGIENYPMGLEDSAQVIQYMKDREDENSFYRTEVTHEQTLNDGALNGYYGLSTFSSSANRRVTQFMQYMGQAALPEWNRYCYEHSSPVANLFLNLKYMIERERVVPQNSYFDTVYTQNQVTLLENNAYLPLGFMTQSKFADFKLSADGGPFEVQNQMFKAATGLNNNVWLPINGQNLVISATEATIHDSSPDGYVYYSSNANSGTIHYAYTADNDGLLCMNLDFIHQDHSFSLFVNGEIIVSDFVNLAQMFAVCDVKKDDLIQLDIYCNSNETDEFNVSAAILFEPVFRHGYSLLSESTLEITDFEADHIKGRINCKQAGLLYTSIPYDGNWEVIVDGKTVDIVLIADAMTGVMLTPGEHTVEFIYRNQAFTMGLALSLSCLVLFVALIFLYRVLEKRKEQNASQIHVVVEADPYWIGPDIEIVEIDVPDNPAQQIPEFDIQDYEEVEPADAEQND